MDNSSSSESGMDDASMDDSDQEHEYDYDLDDPEAHEDYEDVPEDDEDDMDDDDDHSAPVDLTALAGGPADFRIFAHPSDFRRIGNGFSMDQFDASSIFTVSRDDLFRDMVRETVQSLSAGGSHRTAHHDLIRAMHAFYSPSVVEPMTLLPSRMRHELPIASTLRQPDPPTVHPVLCRPYVPPPPEYENYPPFPRPTLRPPQFDQTTRESSQTAAFDAIARVQRATEATGSSSSDTVAASTMPPNPLRELEELGLMRSVDSSANADAAAPSMRNRSFERLSSRDRDRDKIPSGLARRWNYEPSICGGDSLHPIFDADAAHRRNGKVNPVQPMVATETHESVNELAKEVIERITRLLRLRSRVDDDLARLEEQVERRNKAKEEKEADEKEKGSSSAVAAEKEDAEDKEEMEVATSLSESRAEPGSVVERDDANPREDEFDETSDDIEPDDAPEGRNAERIPAAIPAPDVVRSAPGLTNAQEEVQRPDLVMASVDVPSAAEQEGEVNPDGEQTDGATAAPSSDFSAVATQCAAAAGISLDAPANENPEIVRAAIESTGIDPTYLSALPEDIRAEILNQYLGRIHTGSGGDSGPEASQRATTVNQDFLVALPPGVRAEVLELNAEYQSRQERNAQQGNNRNSASGDGQGSGAAGAGAEMDNATFLATLAPELREEILLESGEAFIQSLPPVLAAEARLLREREASSRLSWRVNRQELSAMGFESTHFPNRLREAAQFGGRREDRNQTREAPIYKWKKGEYGWLREGPNQNDEPTASLDAAGLSSLVQLLWVRHGQYGKTLVNQVLSHACKTTGSRLVVLEQLIHLITSSSSRNPAAGPSSEPENSEIERSRQHGTAVRRGVELLASLCKNDAVVAETLLGLPKSREELKNIGSASLTDDIESETASPKISLLTLVSLLNTTLFVRSNSHLELLIGIINTVCQSMPPSKIGSSKPDRRSVNRAREVLGLRSLPHSRGDPMNFFLVEDDDDSPRSALELRADEVDDDDDDDADDDADDDEESEDDPFDMSSGEERDREPVLLAEGGESKDKEEDEQVVPVQFRVPKLGKTELVALCKVLLRTGCSERTYEKTSRAVGLLGELPVNRACFLSSLVSSATDAGLRIQKEFEHCIKNLQTAKQARTKAKSELVSSFSDVSAANELTLLRIVKCLAALLKHDAARSADGDEGKTGKGKVALPSAPAEENPYRMSMLHGLQELWNALDRLLELVSEETKSKESEKKDGTEKRASIPTPAQLLHHERMRAASRGLSPVLARLSPLIEAFLVTHAPDEPEGEIQVDETASRKSTDMLSPPASPSPKQQELSDEWASKTLDGKLSAFVERHRGPINALLRANTSLLESSFKATLRHPHAIDFDNKKVYFRNVIRRRSSEAHAGSIRINVRRDRVFDDSYQQLRKKTPEEMRGRLHVQFAGEEGVDAGGVTREWYMILARQIFDPNYVLFTRCAAKAATYQPDKRSYINREHLDTFRFVGRIIGKAIYDGQLLDAYFTRSFYKHILGLRPTYHDIETQDPEYYKSLKWMLENDCTGILDYTMSAEYDEFGKQTIIDLIPDGRNIPVTEENKAEYVRLVTEVRMTKAIERQIEAFKEGFYGLIPFKDCKIFNEVELELLMSGLPDIDVADLKANVEYTGYTASSPQINWFWRCVGQMDQEDLARMVMFVTGTSKVPLEGFSNLQGMNGVQKFQIHRIAGDSMRLPSAHTCFNQLDIPEYSTSEILSERLLRAVRECSVGFGFA